MRSMYGEERRDTSVLRYAWRGLLVLVCWVLAWDRTEAAGVVAALSNADVGRVLWCEKVPLIFASERHRRRAHQHGRPCAAVPDGAIS